MMPAPAILSADTLLDSEVANIKGEDLGKIVSLGMDVEQGRIAYAVLSFGGFMGLGDKWFAVPWDALEYSPPNGKFILNVDKDFLKASPGFDKNHWPDVQDRRFASEVYKHYGRTAYWEK
jgi:hypothetical protein